jgi:hypothetical protein
MNRQLCQKALKHALDRLNAIPHRYDDTDFRLIEKALDDLRRVQEPIGLVVVAGGNASVHSAGADVRIVDLDNIRAGDRPPVLPAGIGFEGLCRQAGLGRAQVAFANGQEQEQEQGIAP